MNAKNESELGGIYIPFVYISISFYIQHLKITCKLCTPVRLEVRRISHGTLLPLTLKTNLNMNLVNIFNSTLNSTLLLSVIEITNLNYTIPFLKIIKHIFFNCNDLGTFFEYYTQKLNVLLQLQQDKCVRYLLHH